MEYYLSELLSNSCETLTNSEVALDLEKALSSDIKLTDAEFMELLPVNSYFH